MKVSELYNQSVVAVDQLQKALQNHVRDQLVLCQDLASHQDQMKRLAHIIITEGDRELQGNEVFHAALPKDFTDSINALVESLNNNFPSNSKINVVR